MGPTSWFLYRLYKYGSYMKIVLYISSLYCLPILLFTYLLLEHFDLIFSLYNDPVSRLEGFVSNREQSYEDPIEE